MYERGTVSLAMVPSEPRQEIALRKFKSKFLRNFMNVEISKIST
jgi:hypothetical protein